MPSSCQLREKFIDQVGKVRCDEIDLRIGGGGCDVGVARRNVRFTFTVDVRGVHPSAPGVFEIVHVGSGHHRFGGFETEESDSRVVRVGRAFVCTEEFAGEDAVPVDGVVFRAVNCDGVAEDG